MTKLRYFAIVAAVALTSGISATADDCVGRFRGFVEIESLDDFEQLAVLSDVDQIVVFGYVPFSEAEFVYCGELPFWRDVALYDVLLITRGGKAVPATMWSPQSLRATAGDVFEVCGAELICGIWGPFYDPNYPFYAVEYALAARTPILP